MTQTSTPALPFPVTPRCEGDPEADLFAFGLIHRTLRQGTRMIAEVAASIAAGGPCDRRRQEAVVAFTRNVLEEVTVHHSREDDVLWPVIAASAGPHVDLDPLSDDHVALHAVLHRAEQALALFATDVPRGAVALAQEMTTMADELDEHIADEEAEVFPVIRRWVSAADFARCEESFRKGSKPAHAVFVVHWALSVATPEEAAKLLTGAPAPLKLMLALTRRGWTRRRDLVRG